MKRTRSKHLLLGLLAVGLCTAAVDQGVITIHSFPGGSGGGNAWGGLAAGGDGKFYGTTAASSQDNPGTFFSVTPAGAVSTLHVFDSSEGNGALSSLTLGKDGYFYGAAYTGGATPAAGCIFRVSKAGVVTVLHSFDSNGGPRQPYAGLVQAGDGNFYGTSNYGGGDDVGTIFKMTPDGSVTLLHAMVKATEGSYPSGTLIQGQDGSLYGSTQVDGAGKHGAVFKISTGGAFSIVHSFAAKESSGASWGLVKGADGKLYGVSWGGGAYGGGTLFSVDQSDNVAVVHSFNPASEYYYPYAALTLASDGKLYGTTLDAPVGSPPAGAIFRFDPATGTVETLHLFSAAGDGSRPYAEMLQGADGYLYGTTYAGGDYDKGTVFRFDIGAPGSGSSSGSSSSSSSGSSGSSSSSSGSSSSGGSSGGSGSSSSSSSSSGSSSSSSSSSSGASSSSGGGHGSSSSSGGGSSTGASSSGGTGSGGGGGAASPGLIAVLLGALLRRRRRGGMR